MRRVRLSRGSSRRRISRLAPDELKSKINDILFRSSPSEFPEHQMLRVVIRSDKAHHLGFLKGFTNWHAIGDLAGLP